MQNNSKLSQMNLDWLSDLIRSIPERKATRKNFIAIAGYPKWENVNSNLLAFYLDEREEHGFGRLFFNSLIDIYFEKINSKEVKEDFLVNREVFDSDFQVEREVYTPKGNRVDLVLKESNRFAELDSEEKRVKETKQLKWSIIIENKIDADIKKNDLIDYWNVASAKNKVGIVLSIEPIIDTKLTKRGIHYENILHKELMDRVQLNLPDFYIASDDRHLLFLKEFIINTNSYYINMADTSRLDKLLKQFQDKGEHIRKLKEEDSVLLKYVYEAVVALMIDKGYKPDVDKVNSSRLFYLDEKSKFLIIKEDIEIARKFRCWVNIERIQYENIFRIIFELWGKENTKFGERLKDRLREKKLLITNIVSLGKKGKSGSSYQHIYDVKIPIKDLINQPFSDRLKKTADQEFFQKGFINTAIEELKEIMQSDKST